MRNRRWRIWLVLAVVGVLTILLLWGAPLRSNAQGPTATPDTSQDIANWAQRTIDASGRAVDSANTILSLIQVMSIFIGALLAIAGVLGLRSVTDLRTTREQYLDEVKQMQDKSRAFEDRIEENLKAIRQQTEDLMKALETRIETTTSSMQQQSESQMEQMRNQGDRSVQALTLLQLGKQQMDSGNIDAAMETLRQAWTFEPNNRAVNYFMGELHINKRDDIDAGIERLKAAGAEIESDSEMFLAAKAAYAYALRRKGEQAPSNSPEQREYFLKSEWHFLEALKRNPRLLDIDGESFYGALGGLYRRQGRLNDAIECYERALVATKSNSSYPFNNLGILYTMKRDTERARQHFERAIRAASQRLDDKPLDYWARFDMVTAQTMLGNAQEVAKHLPLALQAAPDGVTLTKFMGGLRELQHAAPSDLLEKVISAVQQNIEQRKKADS